MCESKTIDIDMENLIVQVDRKVTLGELDEYAAAKGLMFAPYTPDKSDLTIGEMYQEQFGSLTGQKYGLPKYHVMGLEVLLADGKILKTGGKTVKNVTGYDLTRLFISSRDTIGMPTAFTLKLLPKEETHIFYLLNMSGSDKLQMLLNKMSGNKVVPAVSCFWDVRQMKPVEVLLGFSGIKEKVEQDLIKLAEIVQEIKIDISLLEDGDQAKIWKLISQLRKNSYWLDCFKILPEELGRLLDAFHNSVSLGMWGNPVQGTINVMLPEDVADEKIYQKLVRIVKGLNGATNWYYDRRYHMENPLFKILADRLQNTFGGRGNRDEQAPARNLGK
ncbi:MAG: FAD-binding oxidoreductase [Desulfitobacteriaceae bacterium]|nr:FAD-binding oxidoreductase [Desulfitobacteriaceae bacterium]